MRTNCIATPVDAGPLSALRTCQECGKEAHEVHVIRTADETPRLTLCIPCLRMLYDNVIAILRRK